jgi:N-methylhydantoinase A/oxoprolinase/acetone carboxylase beta subunit
MHVALGIDTGGTYTDAALVDHETGEVLVGAKALTTRQNLAVGIHEAITTVLAARAATASLRPDDIVLVGLSTTLATNAMVEGQGGPVCLLLLGYDPQLMKQYHFERELGTTNFAYVRGRHNEVGDETAPLDEDAVRAVALAQRDAVEAFAISGYFSVHNPAHELRARAIIQELTGLPATCGHELSTQLNAVRRATTAALNARLIAPLRELMLKVRQSLDELGIIAPLMVVKGDGSLVQAQWATQRPIETILSGPAASVVGGWHLAGRRDAWVVDVGGTTTDIAALRDGLPSLNAAGARVGGWRTMVQAIDVYTTGLGGDSHVRWGEEGDLAIGPRRVVPLSLLAATHPEVCAELREQAAAAAEGHPAADMGEFILAWRQPASLLDESDAEVLRKFDCGPQSLHAFFTGLHRTGLLRSRIESLLERGLLQRSAFTPTDALHVLGRLSLWDAEAARLGAELLARATGLTAAELCERVVAGVARKAATALVGKVVEDKTGQPCDWARDPTASAFLASGLCAETDPAAADDEDLRCQFALKRPIVAIGAPVEAYMPRVAQLLHTELVIPAHAEVANAVGAVVGGVLQRVEVKIERLPGEGEHLRMFLPDGWYDFEALPEAAAYAERVMLPYAESLAHQAGAEHVEVKISRQDHWARTGGIPTDGAPQKLYLGSNLVFIAAGRPSAVRTNGDGAGEA